MLKEFLININKNQLFDHNDKLLLAHSGGKDSMALSHLLLECGFNFEIAHCNFGLRGSESDQDQVFVQDFCKKHQIIFHTKNFNTKHFANEKGLSTQMAARELRYEWFNELIGQFGFDYLLTAHHLNDRLETLIFNLCKGSGPKGLVPIPQKNGHLVRPLANFGLNEIMKYIDENHISWREDSSNSTDDYSRNIIRHQIIPVLQQINPGLWDTQKRNFDRFENLNVIFEQNLDQLKNCFEQKGEQWVLNNLEYHKNQPGFGLLIAEYLKPLGFNFYQSKNLLESFQTGKIFLAENYKCIIERDQLIVSKIESEKYDFKEIMIEKEGVYNFQNLKISIRKIDLSQEKPNFYTSEKAYFSFSKLRFPLTIRTWQAGDYFVPFGMKGSKSISDFLTDIKIASHIKKQQLVLISENQIAWLIHHRTSELFRILTTESLCYEISIPI